MAYTIVAMLFQPEYEYCQSATNVLELFLYKIADQVTYENQSSQVYIKTIAKFWVQ